MRGATRIYHFFVFELRLRGCWAHHRLVQRIPLDSRTKLFQLQEIISYITLTDNIATITKI